MVRFFCGLLLAGCLLLSINCTVRENVTTIRTVIIAPPEPPPPAPSVSPRPRLIFPSSTSESELLERAGMFFSDGEDFLQQGRSEQARDCFRDALQLLKSEKSRPRVEEEYYRLLGEAQALEARAAFSWDGPDWYLREYEDLTPLDQIIELNLFTIEVGPHLRDKVSDHLLQTRFDIPVVLNEAVLKFLEFYQGQGRRLMEAGLRRSGLYLSHFKEIFKSEGVPIDLIYLPQVESLFSPQAYSRARAKGIWQFVAGTGRAFGLKQNWWVDERSDFLKSTVAAARYLKELHEVFGDWYLALAAYNVGPARIEKILKRHGPLDFWTMVERRLLPEETVRHVPSFLATLLIFRNPQLYGFDVQPEPSLEYDTVSVEGPLDLAVVAEAAGLTAAELRLLNPELKHGITPWSEELYSLRVPLGTAQSVLDRLPEIPREKRRRLVTHEVRQGDTLWDIARKYSIGLDQLVKFNGIRDVHRLKLGQELVIPLQESP